MVSTRQSWGPLYQARSWVVSPKRSATSLNCWVTGNASPPVDSAYPWYGVAAEARIRASSWSAPMALWWIGSTPIAAGSAARTATPPTTTAHRRTLSILHGNPGADESSPASPGEDSSLRRVRLPGQSAGPVASVMVAVCDWPELSVQLSVILSPGWWPAIVVARSCADETDLPSTEVMTSPACRPAEAAGVPLPTDATTGPLWESWSDTPRNAGLPMWIVLEACPDSILSAMLSALLIGMAYAAVCPPP